MKVEEKATNFETMRHIERVRNLLQGVVCELLNRARLHDQSKLDSPEVEAFTAITAELAGLTYGSPEYNASRAKLGPALTHHYANNRHHPEHFRNGIRDMNLVDLIEMLCDWKAASERHNDGNIRKSIEHNGTRFQMSSDLIAIFNNSVELVP